MCWCERFVPNRVRETNRVVGGRSPPEAPSASEREGLGAWRRAPTRIEGRLGREGLTHHEASSTCTCRAPRREALSVVRDRQEFAEQGHGLSTRETHAPYTGGGDCHRASEASSSPTRGHYPYARLSPRRIREKQARQERQKNAPKGLTKGPHRRVKAWYFFCPHHPEH